MSTRIKLDQPNPKPSSDDTSFYKEWNSPHKDIDVNEVLNARRKQKEPSK